ncbi:MAG: hypothetical protein EZS28_047336, partial [Streblomastix strix]
TIWPWNAIIFAYDEVLSFRILSVDSCIFKGLGSQIPVRRMIYQFAVFYRCQYSYTEIIVDNTTFENINLINSGEGALLIDGYYSNITLNKSAFNNVIGGAYIHNQGYNSHITINGSTFENCRANSYFSELAALNINAYSDSSADPNQYIITYNKFTNNVGYYTGGIYGRFHQGDWNIYNARNMTIDTFKESNSTSRKSIFVEFRINDQFDMSRYVDMKDLKLDDIYISSENKQNVPENEGTETVKDAIKEIINKKQESYIIVPTNEVYEESNIVITGDKQFILQPTQTSGEEIKPILQASTNQDSLMTVSGYSKVQIDGFVIAHINEDFADKPLLEMSGNSLLQLIGITVSPNKRTKDDKGIHIE